ncbi:MAG: DUF4407 domain-containing protein [Muribaculaceae bacterium]|nr:DUF4407 domain-containing protein [Muribaculaceae bacterium]
MRSENTNIQQNEIIERCSLINEFLWTCAGVNKKVLRQCPGDYAKYAGIGGTILFTALMAMLSGGYALFFVFKSVPTSIMFGLFWGLLIFNLDRFIVNTMYSDGKHSISWGEIKSGLPRIIMAIFLGIVISTPLELKIYESEITVKIEEDRKKAKDEYIARDRERLDSLMQVQEEIRDKADNLPQGIALTGQAKELQNQLTSKQAELNITISDIASLRHQRSHYNPTSNNYANLTKQINAKSAIRNKLNSEVLQLQGELGAVSKDYQKAIDHSQKQKDELIKNIQEQIDVAKANMNDNESYNKLIDEQYGGFQARLKAFHELEEDDTSTYVASWFIMLLFIIIETAPTFFKMMMEDGPYDDLLNAEKHRVRVLSQKQISDINDDVNTEVQISTQKNQERLNAEILANKELMERIAKAQAELLQTAIDAWRAEELEKIKANPSLYIKSNSSENNQQ